MDKQIKVTINEKLYWLRYTINGNSYMVDTDYEELKPHLTSAFIFIMENGTASYPIASEKTSQIAALIIPKILENEK